MLIISPFRSFWWVVINQNFCVRNSNLDSCYAILMCNTGYIPFFGPRISFLLSKLFFVCCWFSFFHWIFYKFIARIFSTSHSAQPPTPKKHLGFWYQTRIVKRKTLAREATDTPKISKKSHSKRQENNENSRQKTVTDFATHKHSQMHLTSPESLTTPSCKPVAVLKSLGGWWWGERQKQ